MSEIERNVDHITFDDKEIIIVGTAHISKKSVELVRRIIEMKKPDIVGIELCKKRYETLVNRKRWEETNIGDVIKEGKTSLFLVNILLAAYQRKIGDRLGVKPGSEMIEAMSIAKENDIEIALLDRDIQITLKRAWNSMSLWEKLKLGVLSFYDLLYGVLLTDKVEDSIEKQIEQLKDKDAISEMLKELSRLAPSMKKSLIDERDVYIADKIITAANKKIENKKIVAVVGAGHAQGIIKEIEKHKQKKDDVMRDISALETVKEGRNILKYITYAIPLILVGSLAYGFLMGGWETVIQATEIWLLANMLGAGIGALLASAHPLSILTAALASPFTSLNPTLAAGWLAGYVEAKMRKPTVKDFEGLYELKRIGDLWHNNVGKVLLVVIFVNFGSSVGAVGAILTILGSLA